MEKSVANHMLFLHAMSGCDISCCSYLANARQVAEVGVGVGKQDCSARNCASNVKGRAPTSITISILEEEDDLEQSLVVPLSEAAEATEGNNT
ncbi:hypothetical protein JTB14_000723 [Gonioctena quinquepunctata]|nr:hypothetical protein JTB14_000723 [Gonioctena quinquepunctata]